MKIIVEKREPHPLSTDGIWKGAEWWQDFCHEDHDVDEILFDWGGKYRETWNECWIEFEDERKAALFLMRWS